MKRIYGIAGSSLMLLLIVVCFACKKDALAYKRPDIQVGFAADQGTISGTVKDELSGDHSIIGGKEVRENPGTRLAEYYW